MTRYVLDALFPPSCAGCAAMLARFPDVGLPLCPTCLETLERLIPPWCPICGLPLWGGRCPDCARLSPRFDVCRAVFVYSGEIRTILLALKHARAFEMGRPLGRLMAATAVATGISDADMVVPVPTTVSRLVSRGYNQAALLAGVVASSLGRRMEGRVLRRTRDPGSQGRQSRETRARQVRGCFSVVDSSRVRGRRVLLVDDVVTTGATASECAGVLKDAGAAWVGVLAVARAVGDR